MFRKTTGLMSKDDASRRSRAIRNLLSSGEGFVQMHEEDDKYFLLMEVASHLKEKVLSILKS